MTEEIKKEDNGSISIIKILQVFALILMIAFLGKLVFFGEKAETKDPYWNEDYKCLRESWFDEQSEKDGYDCILENVRQFKYNGGIIREAVCGENNKTVYIYCAEKFKAETYNTTMGNFNRNNLEKYVREVVQYESQVY